jgi:large subunit ribosomal protein L25
MAEAALQVDPRSTRGKKLKALRREGVLPANIYGRGIDSVAVQAPKHAVQQLLRTTGRNVVIDLHVNGEGKPRPVLLRSLARNPVTGDVLHLDFQQVSLTEKMHADVPLVLAGEPPAVSVFGGILLQSLDHLVMLALPDDLPSLIEVDVSNLTELESSIHVRDLTLPPNVEVVTDIEQVVAKVAAPRVAEKEEEAAVEGEEAAAPAAEGAEAPAAEAKAGETKEGE